MAARRSPPPTSPSPTPCSPRSAEEMGEALGRSAYSPNIKERRDYSCAVFDPGGAMVAQAAHMPVHLGSMPASVRAVLDLAPFAPGDVCALNDPFLGGTHLPDLTTVAPVFDPSLDDGYSPEDSAQSAALLGFVATRAHHADIGGIAPGSMPVATELLQEGIVVPPLRLVTAGTPEASALALFVRNSRAPDERPRRPPRAARRHRRRRAPPPGRRRALRPGRPAPPLRRAPRPRRAQRPRPSSRPSPTAATPSRTASRSAPTTASRSASPSASRATPSTSTSPAQTRSPRAPRSTPSPPSPDPPATT